MLFHKRSIKRMNECHDSDKRDNDGSESFAGEDIETGEILEMRTRKEEDPSNIEWANSQGQIGRCNKIINCGRK
jgi:hypothetical protein